MGAELVRYRANIRIAGDRQEAIAVIPITENCADGSFDEAVFRISSRVIQSVRDKSPLDMAIGDEADSIYIKSADGKILLTNRAYDNLFAGALSPVGRTGTSFLASTLLPISMNSDSLILEGCLFVQFGHVGHDNEGRELRLLTHKRSILGVGHPTMAILGITRLVEVINSGPQQVQPSLRALWQTFGQLDELDRNIAIGLARGKSVATIATESGVTKKTIENHRSSIIRALGFKSAIDVIKLMVRLQENGFGDFGV